jgi:acetyltransferase-like isoleucine patch superfamily enzyme
MRKIGRHAVISEDASLGQDVTIGNHVTVYAGVCIADGCTVLDGAVLGRAPRTAGNSNRPVAAPARPLTIGPGTIIGANAVLYAGCTLGASVLIGDLASVREGCEFGDQAVIGRGVLVMYDTSIGPRSRVIDGAILTGNMTVEADVFIGPGVQSINDNEVYLKRFGLAPFAVRGPVVRRFALVGAGANLAAGVEIGMGAIVAPSAMVTRDVPPWMVVAGVPARPVRAVSQDERNQVLAHFGLQPLAEAG